MDSATDWQLNLDDILQSSLFASLLWFPVLSPLGLLTTKQMTPPSASLEQDDSRYSLGRPFSNSKSPCISVPSGPFFLRGQSPAHSSFATRAFLPAFWFHSYRSTPRRCQSLPLQICSFSWSFWTTCKFFPIQETMLFLSSPGPLSHQSSLLINSKFSSL